MEHYNGAWVASNRGVCIILYGDNVAEATLKFFCNEIVDFEEKIGCFVSSSTHANQTREGTD